MLSIYVDDFLMSGPSVHLSKGWDMLRSDEGEVGLKIEQQIPIGTDIKSAPGKRDGKTLYLGCYRSIEAQKGPNGSEVRVMRYNMTEFVRSSCALFENLANQCGVVVQYKKTETPFRPEDNKQNPAGMPLNTGDGLRCPWCYHTFVPQEADKVTEAKKVEKTFILNKLKH